MKNTPAIPPLTEMKRPSHQSSYTSSKKHAKILLQSFAASGSGHPPLPTDIISANSDFFAIYVILWHAVALMM
jgi:hypothetical protein